MFGTFHDASRHDGSEIGVQNAPFAGLPQAAGALLEQLDLCGCTFQLKHRCMASWSSIRALVGGFNGQKILGHHTDALTYLWPHAGRMVNGRLSLAPDEVALQ